MIIFDLDGTLADCEHRRHLVQVDHPNNLGKINEFLKRWNPDWDAFYQACDEDQPIEPVISIWNNYEVKISCRPESVQIWSGRSEIVRKKTIEWLEGHLFSLGEDWWEENLKMRPIGDSTPDDILKEKWLDEYLSKGKKIEFVFDDRPKVIRMWRRRGIFVFNCNQNDKEF